MDDGLTVRAAAPHEVVEVRWPVLRPGRPRETASFVGDDAPDTRHWVAVLHGVPVGCVTVVAQPWEGVAWRLRGMAVLPSLQRRGVGRRLLDVVHAEVSAPMWCDAREVAVPFYAAAGWQVRSGAHEIAGIGPHHKMTWEP